MPTSQSHENNNTDFGWKIEKGELPPSKVLTKLYNLARPNDAKPISIYEAIWLIKAEREKATGNPPLIERLNGVTLHFRPDGSTSDKRAWDLFSYLQANPHVMPDALQEIFGDALKPMPLPEKGWSAKVLEGVRAKQVAEKEAVTATR